MHSRSYTYFPLMPIPTWLWSKCAEGVHVAPNLVEGVVGGGIPLSNNNLKFFKNYVENFFRKIYK